MRFTSLEPASARASIAARGASRKRDTKCELVLRQQLAKLGLRYRLTAVDLPGKPDIVFRARRVAVFCDGDFWHGRDLEARLARLAAGHNAPYWVAKIRGNVERDRRHTNALEAAGWLVLRYWETEILRDAPAIATGIAEAVARRVRAR